MIKEVRIALLPDNIRRELDQRLDKHRMADCAFCDFRRHLPKGVTHLASEAFSDQA